MAGRSKKPDFPFKINGLKDKRRSGVPTWDMLRPSLFLGLLAFLAFVFLGLGVSRALAQGRYIWPVKARPKIVTSVLCDPRIGHPHGGIDISLFGKVGEIPILSAGEGFLMRIRSSKYGYGKAVYVRMPDKKVAVYAHLDRFSPKIERVARDIRRRTGRARLDYYFEDREMTVPVGRGEVIGFGGKTGTSTAHLHFEIRHDDLYNLNPLTNGFAVADEAAPRIASVLLVPVDADSRVNGKKEPLRITRSKLGTRAPRSLGRVGLAVDAFDRHRPKGRKFSPYRILVRIDGRDFFETRYESWGYVDRNVHLAQYDFDATGKKRFLRAYNPYPVAIPFFSEADAGTFERLSPGPHKVEVTAADAAGLYDSVSFTLKVEPGADPPARPWPRGSGALELFNGRLLAADGGRFVVEGFEHSFFEPVRVDVFSVDAAPPGAEGRCYRVTDPGVSVRRTFGVRFGYDPESEPNGLGIYAMDPDGPRFLGNALDPFSNTMEAETTAFGDFCLLRDLTKPRITTQKAARAKGEVIRFRVRDDLAGPDAESVAVTIDGKLAVTDFSRAKGVGSVRVYWNLSPGTHTAKISIADRVGNAAERRVRFELE